MVHRQVAILPRRRRKTVNYLIRSRPCGSKVWRVETVGYRYDNIEAAEARLTHLRFHDRKTEYQAIKDEDWPGMIRNSFKVDEAEPKTPRHEQPRGRRPRS